MKRLLVVFGVLLVLGSLFVLAGEVELVYFYEDGCSHCLRIDALLQRMQGTYEELAIVRYEIHAQGSIELLQRLEQLYGISVEEIPTIFINDETFQGAGRAVEYNIEQVIRMAIDEGSTSPLVRLEQSEVLPERVTRKLTIPAQSSLLPGTLASYGIPLVLENTRQFLDWHYAITPPCNLMRWRSCERLLSLPAPCWR